MNFIYFVWNYTIDVLLQHEMNLGYSDMNIVKKMIINYIVSHDLVWNGYPNVSKNGLTENSLRVFTNFYNLYHSYKIIIIIIIISLL